MPEWMNIERNANHNGCGIYKIRLVKKGYPIEIPRLLDIDKDGILMIGSSTNIDRRIKCFRGAMNGGGHAHSAGQRLYLLRIYTNFSERYNNCEIQYSFASLPNENMSKDEEERLLKCYFKRYGEVPPLNNNLPNRIDWENLNCDYYTRLY